MLFYNTSFAEEFDIEKLCKAKANIVSFAFENRNTHSTKQMLSILEEDWRDSYSRYPILFSHATHVDMMRIIRDVTRVNNKGEFRMIDEQHRTELLNAYHFCKRYKY